ncbi:MAG TPA: TonB-dependent receptor [Bacteroidales bacterium]|nr:TonB-dependent receptor [Bacteroidales bacterium]HPT04915.1 TonB-dependent receptor [Bacteroidales bacterium]
MKLNERGNALIIILTSFLLLFATCLKAQTITQTVKGTIIDQANELPLPGATVVILHTDPLLGAASDANGNFRIEKVPVGRYNIKVSYLGYEPYMMKEIMISSGKETVLNIRLKESLSELKTVEIKANTNKEQAINTMATLSARQLSVEEAARYAGGFDDPARLTSSFAGVTGSLGNNGIIVRGNTPRGLLWEMEGVEISNPSHFADVIAFGAGGITALSSQMLANSDFYTGAFPAEYGNALSGVFDIKLRNGNNEKRENTFQLGVIGTDISSEGPFVKGGKSSYLFNYRYSTYSLIASILPDDAGGNKYQDLSFKMNFPTQKAGTFSLWGLGSFDQTKVKAETNPLKWKYDQDMEKVNSNQGMGALGFSNKLIIGKSFLLSSTLAVSGNGLGWDVKRINSSLGYNPKENLKNNTWKYTFSTSYNHKFSAKHTNKTGITIENLNYDIDIKHSDPVGTPMVETVNEQGNSFLLQAFSQSKFDITRNLTLNAGVHAQYFVLNDHYSVEPRIGMKWQVAPGHSFSIGYGNHSRLEMLGIYLARTYHSDSYSQPNKKLDFTKANHFVLGYDCSLGEFTHLKIEPYYQMLYNIPVIPDSSFSLINVDKNWFINDSLVSKGKGTNIGVDITLERYLNNGFYYLLTASVFDSKYKGGDDKEYNTRYNKNFVINLLAGKEWRTGRKNNNIFGLNGKVTYMGGDHISPVNVQASLEEKDVVYDEYHAFSNRKPDVLYVSTTISYRINKAHHASIWSLQLLNVTGTKEFNGYRYNYIANKIEKEQEAIIVPNISYKIEF